MGLNSEYVKDKNGVWIWNPNPMENEEVLWQGNVVNGFADGEGLLTWYYFKRVVSTFKGSMRQGKPHGYGVYRYADGDIYEGNWCQGQRHGFGRQWFAGGENYIGEWEMDQQKTG